MTARTAAIGDSCRGKILSASLLSFTGRYGTGTKIRRRRFKAGSITSRTPSLTSFRSRAGTARSGWYTEYFHRRMNLAGAKFSSTANINDHGKKIGEERSSRRRQRGGREAQGIDGRVSLVAGGGVGDRAIHHHICRTGV